MNSFVFKSHIVLMISGLAWQIYLSVCGTTILINTLFKQYNTSESEVVRGYHHGCGSAAGTKLQAECRRVFKKRVGPKRFAPSCTSSSRSSFDTEGLCAAEGFSVLSPSYYLACVPDTTSSNLRKVPPCLNIPEHSSESSSGWSSKLENTRRFSGRVLAVLAATLLTFGLTLAFGFWIYSSAFSNTSTVFSHTETTQASAFTVAKFGGWVPDMKTLADEVFNRVTEKEAKWKDTWTREWDSAQREISLLKEERQRQKHMVEDLKMELQNLKTTVSTKNLDRFWFEQQISGAEKQISEMKAHLSSCVKRLQALVSSQRTVVQNAELQGALWNMERRLTDRFNVEKAQEREELLKIVSKNEGALTMQDINDRVQRALRLYKADGVGMADFALESLGSTVIESRCSESFQTKPAILSLFGIPVFHSAQSPRAIIQPEVYLGKCWAFKGDQGFATIALAYPVYITHVTLEHVPKELSLTGDISSAPKEFSIYGMMSKTEEEGKLLGTFLYVRNGEPVQTYELLESVRDVYSVVELRVRSNWGHPSFTCVYRFRVHGQLWTP